MWRPECLETEVVRRNDGCIAIYWPKQLSSVMAPPTPGLEVILGGVDMATESEPRIHVDLSQSPRGGDVIESISVMRMRGLREGAH